MGRESLNEGCGSNFLYLQKECPSGFTTETALGKRLCSLDGDADRLLYWRIDAVTKTVDIMDGDKEMSLASLWIRKQIDDLNLADVTMGVIKTAYANGASNVYAKEHHIPVELTKTGVKHLHPRAAAYDVGLYFEANGHGTVLFKQSSPYFPRYINICFGLLPKTFALSTSSVPSHGTSKHKGCKLHK